MGHELGSFLFSTPDRINKVIKPAGQSYSWTRWEELRKSVFVEKGWEEGAFQITGFVLQYFPKFVLLCTQQLSAHQSVLLPPHVGGNCQANVQITCFLATTFGATSLQQLHIQVKGPRGHQI